jgi:hypothetical protein
VTPKNANDNSNGDNSNWDLSTMRMERIEMEVEERKIEKDRRKIIYLMEATKKDGRKWVKKLGGIPRRWEEAKERTLAIWKEGGSRGRAEPENQKPNPKKRSIIGSVSKERIQKQPMALPEGKARQRKDRCFRCDKVGHHALTLESLERKFPAVMNGGTGKIKFCKVEKCRIETKKRGER